MLIEGRWYLLPPDCLLVLKKLDLTLSLQRLIARLIGSTQLLARLLREQHVALGSLSDHGPCDAIELSKRGLAHGLLALRGVPKSLLPLFLHGRGKLLNPAEESRDLP